MKNNRNTIKLYTNIKKIEVQYLLLLVGLESKNVQNKYNNIAILKKSIGIDVKCLLNTILNIILKTIRQKNKMKK